MLTENETRLIVEIFYNRKLTMRKLRQWSADEYGKPKVGPPPRDIPMKDGMVHRFYYSHQVLEWLEMSEACREHRRWGRTMAALKLETKHDMNAIPNAFPAGADLSKYNLESQETLPAHVKKQIARERKVEEKKRLVRDPEFMKRVRAFRDANLAADRRFLDGWGKRLATAVESKKQDPEQPG
jgi:hypothetical protein